MKNGNRKKKKCYGVMFFQRVLFRHEKCQQRVKAKSITINIGVKQYCEQFNKITATMMMMSALFT